MNIPFWLAAGSTMLFQHTAWKRTAAGVSPQTPKLVQTTPFQVLKSAHSGRQFDQLKNCCMSRSVERLHLAQKSSRVAHSWQL